MIIPLRTDRQPKRRAVVTESLIIINMLVYLTGLAGHYSGWFTIERMTMLGHFDPQNFNALQLITYQFLHDPSSIFHLVFNMLFLWVFGCAVEDRIGRLSFVLFYLMGGIFAGLAHMIVSASPVIGASGSIAAVTGAFIALFPRSRIQILLFFFIIGVYAIPSLWFVAFYLLIDLLRGLGAIFGGQSSGVAYAAHLGGYVYGFVLAFTLVALNIIKREEFDMFYLFKQSRRRSAFRQLNKHAGPTVWDHPSGNNQTPPKRVSSEQPTSHEPSPEEQRLAELRGRIGRLIMQHKLKEAAEEYRGVLNESPDLCLQQDRQLDVASQLYAEGDMAHAAAAYELFLENYQRSAHAARVRLLLATVYARHLNRPDRARELIDSARDELRNESDSQLANQLLNELATA